MINICLANFTNDHSTFIYYTKFSKIFLMKNRFSQYNNYHIESQNYLFWEKKLVNFTFILSNSMCPIETIIVINTYALLWMATLFGILGL